MPPIARLATRAPDFDIRLGALTALEASQDEAVLFRAMDEAIARKPKGHDFIIDRRHNGPAVGRHMSVTGG